ncbi:MAG: hypothetical protein MJZ22_01675 [Candidatus Saccharibacteria bacterium]|nr:hypothetical protein [Candidatus Saccharibacteria bacterium]
MKKFLYILFTIFISGGCIFGGSFKAFADDEERWFSVSELIGDEIPEGAEMAKEVFDGLIFGITSINREKGEISVIFHDKDMMLERFGIHEQGVLNELAMVWIKDRSDYPRYVDFLRSGEENSNISTIYYGNSEVHGAGWLPANTEVTLDVSGADLAHNASGIIDFSISVDPLGGSGGVDYSMCYSDPEYVLGADCKLRISEDMKIGYFPVVREEILSIEEDEVAEELGEVDDADIDENIENEAVDVTKEILSITLENNDEKIKNVVKETENAQRNYAEKGNVDSKMDIQIADSDDNSEIDIPIAGGECGRQIIFPWWILVLIILGDIVVMWLFWPENGKNSKKVEKK